MTHRFQMRPVIAVSYLFILWCLLAACTLEVLPEAQNDEQMADTPSGKY